jgi:predicted ATP-dependent endonuclease of OLD family
MSQKKFRILNLFRDPIFGNEDRLEFDPGLNLIVGPGNSGKTKWLNMLDYLLGDPGKPEDAFPQELVDKYSLAGTNIIIDSKEYEIIRKWNDKGNKGKVFVNNEPMQTEEFQHWLMEELEIPILHYPKGNPFAERAWPELSWRTIYRHIYRQQRFWSDIADKQSESEQFAVLTLFLGIAEHLFSDKSGKLTQLRKDLWKKEGAKEQFISLIERFANEFTDEKELQGVITFETIELAEEKLKNRIQDLKKNRENILFQLKTKIKIESKNLDLNQVSTQWANSNNEKIQKKEELNKIQNRLEELDKYLK